MDWFRRLALQRKLMLMVTVTCSLALLVAGVAFVGYDRLVFQRTMLRELTILADVLGNNSTAVLSFDSPESRASAEDLLAALKAQPHIVTACLYDKSDRVFATYARADANANVPARPERATHRFEPDRLVIFRPVTWKEKPLGMIYLESDLVERTNRLRLYTGVVLAILVTILVATTVFSLRFQKMISKPILSLAETARVVAERKDYSVRATKMSDDELGLLTTAFNDMLTQIQERDADLRKAHDLLEHRVEQRTAELRAANGALQAEISERQRAEEAVKSKAAELERSNAELEQFAYVASHDLQEPLRMVSSYLQLLERRFEGKLDADAKEFMGYAVDGATRMRSLIRDLLEYSRVGRKGRPLVPVDCEAVLATVRHNLQAAINETKAHITSAGLPIVTGDATELTQLFQNLIGNAIKFHGGQPPAVHIEAERKDGLWKFSVRDNGIGIDPQFAERIFVIFQRLHTRESYAGTGIGLAVCRKIVDRLGGRIWVESQPGQGAAFHFTLPGIEEEKPS